MLARLPRLTAAATLALGLATLPAAARDFSEIFLVDFEELEEGTILFDQYAALGVTFAMLDGGADGPVVAVGGSPRSAFSGSGSDRPLASGDGALTDPFDAGFGVPRSIRIDFDPPVTGARFFVSDIDNQEVYVATAWDGDDVVGQRIASFADPDTGNSVNTEFLFTAPAITAITFEPPEAGTDVGWALDFLTFTRPCPEGTCGPRVRVAQESAPGADDFDDHVLGEIIAVPWSGSVPAYYGYGVPEGDSWNGPMGLEADRSHLLVANTASGVTIVMVHDRALPNDPDGGEAEMRLSLVGDPDGAARTMEDDPDGGQGDAYTGEPGETTFTARHDWDPCCTDGWAVSGVDCGALAFISFEEVDGNPGTSPLDGLTTWSISSADGSEIALGLELNRRVRLQVLPDLACSADLDCDADVDLADLLKLLASWGPCSACPADINADGTVGFADLVPLLSDFGDC